MASAFKPGDTLAGKYRVDAIIGSGGMGVVLSATHLHLDEPVAIKVLHKHLLDTPGSQERFFQEARAAAKINHPNCVQVKDVDILVDGTPYIVMELLRGESLAEKLKRKGKLHFREVANLVAQACDALQQAHRLGVVHRDLKPANLFVSPHPDGSEHLKVLDFGVSKVAVDSIVRMQAPDTTFTETNVLLGSPKYMAPEQMASPKGVGPEADVWSLGCILYLALTGEPPFDGPTVFAICSAVLRDEPARPGTLAAMPQEIEGAIVRALKKNPRERYQSVAELREILLRCVVVDALQTSIGAAPAVPMDRAPVMAERIVQMRNGELPSLAATDVTNFLGGTLSSISMLTANSLLTANTLRDAAPPMHHTGSHPGGRALNNSILTANSFLTGSAILDASNTGTSSLRSLLARDGNPLPFTAPAIVDLDARNALERTSGLPPVPALPTSEEVITSTVDRASVGDGTLEGTYSAGNGMRPSFLPEPDFARRGRRAPIVVASVLGVVAASVLGIVVASRGGGGGDATTPGATPAAGVEKSPRAETPSTSSPVGAPAAPSATPTTSAAAPLVLEGAPTPLIVDENLPPSEQANGLSQPRTAAPKPPSKKDPFGGKRK